MNLAVIVCVAASLVLGISGEEERQFEIRELDGVYSKMLERELSRLTDAELEQLLASEKRQFEIRSNMAEDQPAAHGAVQDVNSGNDIFHQTALERSLEDSSDPASDGDGSTKRGYYATSKGSPAKRSPMYKEQYCPSSWKPSDDPCYPNGFCDDTEGFQYCYCKPGYGGVKCQFDNVCERHRCSAGHTCMPTAWPGNRKGRVCIPRRRRGLTSAFWKRDEKKTEQ